MDDHVHAIVQPAPGHLLEDIVRSWKSYSAHDLQRAVGRTGSLWQNEYFDRIVRDYAELREKMTYILNNPRRRWPGEKSYPWVWAIGLG
jgi:putative DNA methylase